MGFILCRAIIEADESLGQGGHPSLSRWNVYCVVRGFLIPPYLRFLACYACHVGLIPRSIAISSAIMTMSSPLLFEERNQTTLRLMADFVGVRHGPELLQRLLSLQELNKTIDERKGPIDVTINCQLSRLEIVVSIFHISISSSLCNGIYIFFI